jgi:hypothetical protein
MTTTQEQVRIQQKQMLGLMGKFDKDPGRYRPLYYGVPITVPVEVGGIGRASITINNQPYLMTHLLHQIVGNTNDYSTTGLAQDGQYLISWKDEQSNYQNVPIPADMLFGSVRSGYIIPLAYPIPFAGNKTLTFEITNLYTRVLVPEVDTFTVYIAIAGPADWGELYPQGG